MCRYTSGGPRNPNTAVNHFTCSLFTEQCSSYRHICLYLESILPAIYLLKKCTQKHIFFRLSHFFADLFRRKSRLYLKNCPSIHKEVFYKTKKPHLCVEINRIFLQGMSSLYPYQVLLAAGLRGVFDWLFMRLELKSSQKGNRLKQSKCDSHHFLL